MDYKELIERIEDCCEFAVAIEEDDLIATLKDTATAIETLLAEREAAIQSIPRNCDTCRYWYDGGCVAPLELFGGCDFGVRQAWEWRGPAPPLTASGRGR